MADQIEDASELSKIAKLNGDFRRNYGTLLGAFLILEVDQRRARSFCVLGHVGVDGLFCGLGMVVEARF